MVAHFVVPFLRALGWRPENIAVVDTVPGESAAEAASARLDDRARGAIRWHRAW